MKVLWATDVTRREQKENLTCRWENEAPQGNIHGGSCCAGLDPVSNGLQSIVVEVFRLRCNGSERGSRQVWCFPRQACMGPSCRRAQRQCNLTRQCVCVWPTTRGRRLPGLHRWRRWGQVCRGSEALPSSSFCVVRLHDSPHFAARCANTLSIRALP